MSNSQGMIKGSATDSPAIISPNVLCKLTRFTCYGTQKRGEQRKTKEPKYEIEQEQEKRARRVMMMMVARATDHASMVARARDDASNTNTATPPSSERATPAEEHSNANTATARIMITSH
jgi:hypothetical protein